MADPDNRVELTDLDVISRYSLAVRAATADRNELIATLRADLEWLQGGRTRRTSTATARSAPEPEIAAEVAPEPARSAKTTTRRSAPDRRAPAVKKATAKKAVSSRAGAARKPAAPSKSTAKKSAAKSTPARKPVATKSTAKKTATKKTSAKKSPRTTVRWG